MPHETSQFGASSFFYYLLVTHKMTDMTDLNDERNDDHQVQGDPGTSLHRRDDQPLGLRDVDNKIKCTVGNNICNLRR